ncbi:hypothetical protein DFA_08710 [Cavenderia fasciculata]|uniref:Uncharacterized protein n=1 Tax=Cavenderia fasciculata TaxID=261658 RepID=F4Q3V7_CACFS|nr:uncharacterized protein DFA_08710 [Cavenderia fasciculata]EGG17713.1 hypothetical protein DFA_08710 [Cavenderia fasciculata]|eukprot:XP_004356197.1 hypothetical protein DFA_08710 [Cavenderia fasciculata]
MAANGEKVWNMVCIHKMPTSPPSTSPPPSSSYLSVISISTTNSNILKFDNATMSASGHSTIHFIHTWDDPSEFVNGGGLFPTQSSMIIDFPLYFSGSAFTSYDTKVQVIASRVHTQIEQNEMSFLIPSIVSITNGKLLISGNSSLLFNESSLSVETTEFIILGTSSLNTINSNILFNTHILNKSMNKINTN